MATSVFDLTHLRLYTQGHILLLHLCVLHLSAVHTISIFYDFLTISALSTWILTDRSTYHGDSTGTIIYITDYSICLRDSAGTIIYLTDHSICHRDSAGTIIYGFVWPKFMVDFYHMHNIPHSFFIFTNWNKFKSISGLFFLFSFFAFCIHTTPDSF